MESCVSFIRFQMPLDIYEGVEAAHVWRVGRGLANQGGHEAKGNRERFSSLIASSPSHNHGLRQSDFQAA